MAVKNVNPTRMELTKLKRKLVSAVRGHKLLKDKRDELMRQFMELVQINRRLRERVEKGISSANKNFARARAVMQDETINTAFLAPKQEVYLDVGKKNVMSVEVPVLDFQRESQEDEGSIFPYGFLQSSSELDDAIEKLYHMMPKLLQLAETEKTCQLMADEIEKTRRRVNALEHRTSPDLEDTIYYIEMKLDEHERSTIIRLIKVKDLHL